MNRVVNSTLRNLSAGRFTDALKASRFTAKPEVGRFTAAPGDDRFLVALENGRCAFPARRPGHRPGSQSFLISSTEV
jgi:hypothetical protein